MPESHLTRLQTFAYLSDDLAPGEKTAVEAHLAACAACAALVERKRDFLDDVQIAMAAKVPAVTLLNRARAEHAKQESQREIRAAAERVPTWAKVVMGFTFAAVLLMIYVTVINFSSPPARQTMYAPVQPSVPEVPDAGPDGGRAGN